MKFLHVPQLAAVTNCLSDREIRDVNFEGRVEAYSLKDAGNDKRLAKELEEALKQEEGRHRERSTSFSHAFGDVRPSPSSSPEPRWELSRATAAAGERSGEAIAAPQSSVDHRTLYFLISTLNASYPDYDFSLLRQNNFVRVPSNRLRDDVIGSVNASLADLDLEESQRPTLPSELEALARQQAEQGRQAQQEDGDGLTGSHKKRHRAPSHTSQTGVGEDGQDTAASAAGGGGEVVRPGRKRSRSDSKAGAATAGGTPPAIPPGGYGSHFLSALWRIVDESIALSECEVYAYVPDMDDHDGPLAGGVWSFAWFFINRNLNRMVYFACRARPKTHRAAQSYPGAGSFGPIRRRENKAGSAAHTGAGASAGAAGGAGTGATGAAGSEEDASDGAGAEDGAEQQALLDAGQDEDTGEYAGLHKGTGEDEEDEEGEDNLEPSQEAEGYGDADDDASAPAGSPSAGRPGVRQGHRGQDYRKAGRGSGRATLPALLASVASPAAVVPRGHA